jgi:hypothetical protein
MEHNRIQSVAFDGVCAFNSSDELLEYVTLVTDVTADDDDNCIINGNTYYFNDIISPLFDIFTAISIIEYDEITEDQQAVIIQLQDLAVKNKFCIGAVVYPSIYDILTDVNNYYGVKSVYDLLGGIYQLDDTEEN